VSAAVSGPTLWIEFPLGLEPRAVLEFPLEGEELRLLDWLRTRRDEPGAAEAYIAGLVRQLGL
jgi:hypothetical protein